MIKKKTLTIIATVAVFASIAALVSLAILVRPLDSLIASLFAALFLFPLIAVVALLSKRQSHGPDSYLSAKDTILMSDDELAAHRNEVLVDFERRLEIREFRLARQLRATQPAADYLDLLEIDASDEELGELVGQDKELMALIEDESQLVFNRVLANRYAAEKGVNTALILADIQGFVEKVARLYRPEADDILLETDIELIATSFSSATLHLLMVVDELPLNLKSYNTAKVYRLLRRGASYYGTYKSLRPYLEHSLNAVQVARLAIGINPIAVGAAWLAGKLTTHGAKAVGERLLQRKALQLLNDIVRVIGYQAAMMYGHEFRYRDANWIFAAHLVNLEVSRGKDHAGRDAALQKLCSVVLRNEFDRVHLLTRLSRHKTIDLSAFRSQTIMTQLERENVVAQLEKHANKTGVMAGARAVLKWRKAASQDLGIDVKLDQ